MGVNVKEAVLVAAIQEKPPTVKATAPPLLIDLLKAKSPTMGSRTGAEAKITLTLPLVANTDAIVPGGAPAMTVNGNAPTAVPLL
jgi:hypothetical protein